MRDILCCAFSASVQCGNELLYQAVAPVVEQTEVISSSMTLESQESNGQQALSEQNTKYPAEEYFEDNFKENAADKEQQGYDLIKQELAQ